MADVVGSAVVVVRPDLSSFARDLGRAIGPAMEQASRTVNTAVVAMTSSMQGVGLALKKSVESALKDTAAAAQAVGNAVEGIDLSGPAKSVGVFQGELADSVAGAQAVEEAVGRVNAAVAAAATSAQMLPEQFAEAQGAAERAASAAGAMQGGVDATTRSVADLGASMDRASQGAGRIGEALQRASLAAVAVGGAAAITTGNIVQQGVAYQTLLQKSGAAFTTILGTKQASDDMISSITEFARSSPFPRQAFIQGAQQMLGFGVEAKKILPIFGSIQDAVAAVGGGAAELAVFTDIFANIQSEGKTSYYQLQRLSQLGINATELMAKAAGVSEKQMQEAISAGRVDAEKGIDLLMKGLNQRYAGGAASLKNTYVGAIDRIKGATRDIGGDLVEPFISKDGGGAAVIWANQIADILRRIQKTIIPPLVVEVRKLINSLMAKTAKLDLDKLFNPERIADIIAKIRSVSGGISALFAGIGAASLRSIPFIGQFMPALNPVLTGILALVATSPDLRAVFGDLINGLVPVLQQLLPTVQVLVGLFGTVLTEILRQLLPVFLPIVEAATTMARTFGTMLALSIIAVFDAIEPLLPVLVEVAQVGMKALLQLLPPLIEVFKLLAPPIVELVGLIAVGLAEGITAVLPYLGSFFEMLGTRGVELVRAIRDKLTEISGFLEGPFKTAWAWLSETGWPAVVAAGDSIWKFFSETLLPKLTEVKDFLDGAFKTAWAWLSETGWPAVVAAGDSIWKFFSETLLPKLTEVKDFLDGAFKTAWDYVSQTLFPALVEAGQSVLDFFHGLLNPMTSTKEKAEALGPAFGIVTGAATVLAGVLLALEIQEAAVAVKSTYMAATAWIANAAVTSMGASAALSAGGFQLLNAALGTTILPFIAIAAAIAAVVVGLIWAYQNIEPFREAVDKVAGAIKSGLLVVLSELQEMWNHIWPLLEQTWQAIATTFTESVLPAVGKLWTSLQGLFDLLSTIGMPVIIAVGAVLFGLWKVVEFLWNAIKVLFDVAAPFVAWLASVLVDAFGKAIEVVSGLVDIFVGIFTWDWEKVKQGILTIATAVLEFLAGIGEKLLEVLPKVGEFFGNLISNIPGWLATAGTALWGALVAAFNWVVENGPAILETLFTWATTIPRLIVEKLVEFGPKLVEWLIGAFLWLTEKAGEGLQFVWDWFTGMPQRILDLLSASLSFILTFMYDAFMWAKDNLPEKISAFWTFFTELPGRIWEKVGDLGKFFADKLGAVFQWVREELPKVVSAAVDWFQELPGRIWEKVGDLGAFVKDRLVGTFQWIRNELPEIAGSVVDWFEKIPGLIWEKVGDLGKFLADKFKAAFDFLKEELPKAFSAALEFFKGLGSSIFESIKNGLTTAAGAITDLGKGIYNAMAGFINDKLLIPIQTFKFNVGPYEVQPFGSFPTLPKLAKGGIFDRATAGVMGEAGREVLIPLTRPARAVELAERSGLIDLLRREGAAPSPVAAPAGGPVDQSSHMDVTVVGVSFEEALAKIRVLQEAQVASVRR